MNEVKDLDFTPELQLELSGSGGGAVGRKTAIGSGDGSEHEWKRIGLLHEPGNCPSESYPFHLTTMTARLYSVTSIMRAHQAQPEETKVRVLRDGAAAELQALLQSFHNEENFIGSVIVGHDGVLIANSLPHERDPESVAVWALGIYMNTEHVVKKMGHDRVHQIVAQTSRGFLTIADFGGGLLVTMHDDLAIA